MHPKQLPLPSPQHIEWFEREMSVLIHQDVEVYDPNYQCAHPETLPPAEVFNPRECNTDQWLECAVAAGCKQAIMVTKHASGYCLFPTSVHKYSIESSPWKNGKGDMVADFVKSCEKYGIKPGLYYSVCDSDYYGVVHGVMQHDARVTWDEYANIVLTQLREIWSRYGEMGELWFDGRMWPNAPECYRERLAALIQELQPNAICFDGDPSYVNAARCCGNEDGQCLRWSNAGYDNRILDYLNNQRGWRDGRYYMPIESVICNHDNYGFWAGWFYHKGEEYNLVRPVEMIERYYASVGHNTTLSIGMVIDDRGLVPDADAAYFKEFGRLLKEQFANKLGTVEGKVGQMSFDIPNPEMREVNMLDLHEDIRFGERISRFKLYGLNDAGQEVPLTFGDAIGHRLLERFPKACYPAYRLRILDCVGESHLKDMSLYLVPRY